ncbi:hypothetical protein ACRAWF_31225 [Streptomyces sp. L7]
MSQAALRRSDPWPHSVSDQGEVAHQRPGRHRCGDQPRRNQAVADIRPPDDDTESETERQQHGRDNSHQSEYDLEPTTATCTRRQPENRLSLPPPASR